MNTFSTPAQPRLRHALMLLLLALGLLPLSAETQAQLDARIALHTYYRLKGNADRYAAVGIDAQSTTIAWSGTPARPWSAIWRIVPHADGYSLQNMGNGKFLGTVSKASARLPLSDTPSTFYFRPSSYQSAQQHVAITWVKTNPGQNFVHKNAGNNLVAWSANNSTTAANASDWILEPVADIAQTDIDARQSATTLPTTGYVYIDNKHYPTRRLSGPTTQSAASAPKADADDYRQLWALEPQPDGRYALRNALTDFYLQNNAGRSSAFVMGTTPAGFSIGFSDEDTPTLTFNGTTLALHAAETAGYQIVGWDASGAASNWYVRPATVDAGRLAAKRQEVHSYLALQADRTRLTTLLSTYFSDAPCTTLKSTFRSMDQATLRAHMNAAALPAVLQDIVLRVHADRWNTHADARANQLEKGFRIHTYAPHSDPIKWAAKDLMHTNLGSYARLTTPTGITARTAEVLTLIVGQDAPAGTTLAAELVSAYSTTGKVYPLSQGVNFIYPEGNDHIYIYYNIDQTQTTISSLPRIPIHIEGGRANGCFELGRHTNADWTAMRNLKAAGFLADSVFRMKSRHYSYSFELKEIEATQDRGQFIYHGQDKGLAGALTRWDEICDQPLEMLSVERYADRFNCLLHAVGKDTGLWAKRYGIYGVNNLNYTSLSEGTENNLGGIWALAHETGHHFQGLFDMAGCKESSNNLFSNIAVWKNGTNVSRGNSLFDLIKHFNDPAQDWTTAGINRRMRLYWQLWLYYVELGNKPTFFRELFDRFRQTPLANGNAKTDFLRFALVCCDVAQEDLSEFFELHGFFKRTGTKVPMAWGDAFYDTNYGKPTIDIAQADIDAAIAQMRTYPKKRNNLFFIDERILPTPAPNKYLPAGTARYATQSNATPGDANEVGDVGMYTDFAPGAQRPAQPSQVLLDGRTVTIIAPGAVGYKVYDAAGKLQFVANRNCFELPASLNLADVRVVVGSADGSDIDVIRNGAVLPPYAATPASLAEKSDNPAWLLLSTTAAAPEHLYYIEQAAAPGSFLDAATCYTASPASKGRFAFFPAGTPDTYYIYSADAGKWIALASADEGENRIAMASSRGAATTWRIERESPSAKTVDFLPLLGNNAWNWYGGKSTPHTSIGMYNRTDAGSSWTLRLIADTPQKADLAEALERAKTLLRKTDVGYPLPAAPARTQLRQAIATYEAKTAPTQTDVMAFTTLLAGYERSSSDIRLPEEGQIYRLRSATTRQYLAALPATDGAATYAVAQTDKPLHATLWICQRRPDGRLYLASALGAGCLTMRTAAQRADLQDQPAAITFQRETNNPTPGTLYMVIDGLRPKAESGKAYVSGTAHTGARDLTADFYVEHADGYTHSVALTAGTNGNFATLHLPYAVALPATVAAHSARPAAGNLHLTPLTLHTDAAGRNILPPYTPAVLSATAPGQYALQPAVALSAATAPSNAMEGTIARVPNSALDRTTYDYYALTQRNGSIIMARITTAAIPANRAYLKVSAGTAPAQGFTLVLPDAQPTAIDATPTPADHEARGELRDLAGRRLSARPHSGVYLEGTRKRVAR